MRKQNILFFSILLISVFLNASILSAGDATLSWDPPATNADGTPLDDLAGYSIYYGTSSGSYSQNIDVGDTTTYIVAGLTEGLTYYFAVTAYDTSMNESDYSNEVSKTIQTQLVQQTLTINKTGTGSGTVTAPGINCGSDCTEQYDQGTVVTLTATPTTGSTFAGWSGACTGTGTCSISINTNIAVTAAFNSASYTITATSGTGGIISPSGSVSVNHGANQTFTITANIGYKVSNVLVDGSSVGPVTTYTFTNVTANHTISASFTTNTYNLTVTKGGTGSGTVTSSPSGINCGSDCSEAYNAGTPVTLTASPDTSSAFAGWSGACTGTGTCPVTMDAAKSVTATFNKQTNITVTSPNGGETWTAGSIYTIAWNYTGDPGYYLKIELLKGGLVVSTVTSYASKGSNGAGSYNWTIPSAQASGNDYRIRVTSTSSSSVTDTSNGDFSILGPTITVTFPNGGETWTGGTTQTIRWNYTGDPGYYLKIELLKGSSVVSTVTSYAYKGSNGAGSYNWTIPSAQASGNDYRIRVTSTSSSSVTDICNSYFTIEGPPPPEITVTRPAGGETWTAGNTETITWTSAGAVGSYVQIELLKGGAVVSTLTYYAPTSSRAYNWRIPTSQSSGADYQIRVSDRTNSSVNSTSGYFTIEGPPPPEITVTKPAGGETWTAGSTYTIAWTYTGDPGYYLKIELLKGGSVVSTITSYASKGSNGAGSYNWVIPSTQASGNDYRIRVTSTSNSSVTDTCNDDFTILGPAITVTSPNGGETWSAGSIYTITWAYTGDPPGYYMKIELLKGSLVVSTITSYAYKGSNGIGSYNWVIPSAQASGNDYRIRVTSTSSSSVTDMSNDNFTIY